MTPTTRAAAILTHARGLVAKGWCQDAPARLQDGTATLAEDPAAAKFCILGALDRAWEAVDHLEDREAIRLATKSIHDALGSHTISDISAWNDKRRRRKRDVLAAFDQAITRTESQPPSALAPGE